jgi:hypothetical protein
MPTVPERKARSVRHYGWTRSVGTFRKSLENGNNWGLSNAARLE